MPTKRSPIEVTDDCILDPLASVFNSNPEAGAPIPLHARTIERNLPELILKIGQKKFIRRDRWKALLRDGLDDAAQQKVPPETHLPEEPRHDFKHSDTTGNRTSHSTVSERPRRRKPPTRTTETH